MTLHDKLMAQLYANIKEIGRIADQIQVEADATRDFLRRQKELQEKHEWTRPEARVHQLTMVGKRP